MINRRKFGALAGVASLTALTGTGVSAQQGTFPSRPLKMVVPFAAGGPGDVVARILSDRIAVELGQSVVVDNRTGANGAIGMQAAIRSPADGYTVLHLSAANVILPLLQPNVYDWERGLVPVFGLGTIPYVIVVNATSNIHSIADLARVGKATPAGLTYGSGGAGSPSHLAPALLIKSLQAKGTHVAYRGLSAAVMGLLSDQVQFVCATAVDVAQLAQAGKVRILAVTSERRVSELPNVPTMVEQGFADFTPSTWYGYLVPAGTPAPVVQRLYAAFSAAASDPAIQFRLAKAGILVNPRTGAELGRFMQDDVARWRAVIKENNISLES